MNKRIKAAILDMDGVLTNTAIVHAKAWKQLFDEFLSYRKNNQKEPFVPFHTETDYPKHLDGIPRYDGIQRFLKSRHIELPFGNGSDRPGFESVCALGNLKNEIFQKQLESEGVEVYQENINAIQQWKNDGLKLAVISSSKNCKQVLEKAGILHHFDVRVDGLISQERNLHGKPAPDIFLEAAKELQVSKEHALVVEDAQLGVEAAKKGGFGWVVGFSAEGEQTLKQHGADEVVSSLKAVELCSSANQVSKLPSALDHFEEIKQRAKEKKAVFFFDYDGTLTPIVEDHTEAFLSEDMRSRLKTIAQRRTSGVVSGRGLDDVRERVGRIPGFYYVGSHGFEIAGPDSFYDQHDEAAKQLTNLDQAQLELNAAFSGDGSIDVERKKFAIAVHYRNAPEEMVPSIERKVDEVLDQHTLKKGTGKKIFELKPDVDWHKGRAIEWLMQELNVDNEDYLPIYLGDDITDEDAFAAIRYTGVGILVGTHGHTSYAGYRLSDVAEVGQFLDKVIAHLK